MAAEEMLIVKKAYEFSKWLLDMEDVWIQSIF